MPLPHRKMSYEYKKKRKANKIGCQQKDDTWPCKSVGIAEAQRDREKLYSLGNVGRLCGHPRTKSEERNNDAVGPKYPKKTQMKSK